MPVPEGGTGWVCQKTAAKTMNWLPVRLPSIKITHGRHEVGSGLDAAEMVQRHNPMPSTDFCRQSGFPRVRLYCR